MNQHLVVIYHSFNDPIFKGLMLKYLQHFQKTGGRDRNTFHIITFEQHDYAIGNEERLLIKNGLQELNLYWYPRSYHSGGVFMLLKKAFDFLSAIYLVLLLDRKYRFKNTIGFTTISGVLALYISKIISSKLVLLNIEPHSDYMVDFNIWKKSGLKYRFLNYCENKMIETADHVALPTRNAYQEWFERGVHGKLYFVPTCIDTDDFYFDQVSRNRLRKEWGLPSTSKVIVYAGKFGGIYYSLSKTCEVFKELLDIEKGLFYYIITPDEPQVVKNELMKKGIDETHFHVIGKIPYKELPKHLSVADFGILLIPSFPSQKYRCPIKTANYLACGIPYIITPGIGDDSELAEYEKIGLVFEKGIGLEYNSLSDDHEFYISVAKENRGLTFINKFLNEIFV